VGPGGGRAAGWLDGASFALLLTATPMPMIPMTSIPRTTSTVTIAIRGVLFRTAMDAAAFAMFCSLRCSAMYFAHCRSLWPAFPRPQIGHVSCPRLRG
jgi:hypothetical protein